MDPEALNPASIRYRLTQAFKLRYGTDPTHGIDAPGRLNVIGEHVDYSGGIVLPAGIQRWIHGVFAPNGRDEVRLYDLKYQVEATLDPNASLTPGKGDWLNYPKGVFAQFHKMGVRIPGFDLCLYSTIPTGGGLSSSAALEALFASIVELLAAVRISPMEKALLCQRAEHEYAGVPCGIMDQVAVIQAQDGHLLKLDCRDLSVTPVPFRSDEVALMIIDSGVHHELAGGEYAKRRRDCEQACTELGVALLRDSDTNTVMAHPFSTPLIRQRALHVVTEIQRTNDMILALERDDFETAGKLLQQSHHSLQYLYEVSCDEVDFITSFCNAQVGVYGSRMMGGGFGGSAIVMLRKEVADNLRTNLEEAYQRAFGIRASAFLTSPSGGVVVAPIETFIP
jgi:galactokinase